MKKSLNAVVIVGSVAVALALGWRLLTRRRSLPCPPWLAWLLENPYMEAVAGSDTILDRLDLRPGMHVLDVGCGPGRVSLPAAERVGPEGLVVALDVQQEMLQRLEQRMNANSMENIQLVHGGIGTSEVEEGAFDRALLVTVLGEIPDQETALAKILTALKPGGVLSVTEVIPDPHYQRQSTVRRLARKVGFVEQSSFGGWLAFTLNFIKPANV